VVVAWSATLRGVVIDVDVPASNTRSRDSRCGAYYVIIDEEAAISPTHSVLWHSYTISR